MTESAELIDAAALMSVDSLALRARVAVEGFWKGLHRSSSHGFSVEFTEYRAYTPGDDPRYLDWRVYARSDRFFVKKFEDETNLRCHLLFDQSASMNYGSVGYTKERYAATLAATLAYFLDGQGDAVGLLTFADAVRDFLPARHRPGHLRQLLHLLERSHAGSPSTDLVRPIERIASLVRKRGLIVYLSDFLAPLDGIETALATLHACGHDVTVFAIADPAERSLNLESAALFEDAESGQRIYIDPALARADYVRRFEGHQAALRATCHKLGIAYHAVPTNRPIELALFELLQSRLRRSRLGRPAAARRA
jgi:uncharacterized protein (DUF58 family)